MPDVLLFGATGYTGRLTAHTLARRNASFAICGRDPAKLDQLAESTGGPEVRVASAGDVDGISSALEGVKVLITCVGPFVRLGAAAAEAAVRTGTHYIDSTGEQAFVGRLIESYDRPAKDKGIALAPCLGFDEVPADVAATLATQGLERPDLVLTYALPSSGSMGTIRSALDIVTRKGPWLEDGTQVMVRAGQETRWSPMPPPLGPRRAMAFPLAEGRLAPLHLDLRSLKLFITTGIGQRLGAQLALPALTPLLRSDVGYSLLNRLLSSGGGPSEERRARSKWTILAEARADEAWRNVTITGVDPYGLTAEFLTAGALRMCEADFDAAGVLAPVQAVGLDNLEKAFADTGITTETYEPKP
ncbi:MAG: saccharopine dehydrogenase family protein [Actinomycetota bacterium]